MKERVTSRKRPLLGGIQAPPAMAQTMVYLWMLVLVGCYVVLRSPATMVGGNRLAADRAAFAAANTASLTGFQTAIAPADYRVTGQVVLVLTVLGSAVAALTLGGMALSRLIRLDIPDERIALWSLGLPLVGGSFLGVIFAWSGHGFLPSMMAGFGAVGNCGTVLGPPPLLNDWRTHVLLLPAALVGSLGTVVLIELYDRFTGSPRPVSTHTRTTLLMTGAIYVGTVVVLAPLTAYLAGAGGGGGGGAPDVHTVARDTALASALAIDARTAGIPVAYASGWPRVTVWLVMLLMAVGGASASTAGGLKVTTVVTLVDGTRRALRGAAATRTFGLAITWLAVYVGIVFATLLALLWTEPQLPADRLLFVAVSAASNVGLAHDPLSITGTGLWVLTFGMLAGRFAPLLVLWRAANTTRADLGIA